MISSLPKMKYMNMNLLLCEETLAIMIHHEIKGNMEFTEEACWFSTH